MITTLLALGALLTTPAIADEGDTTNSGYRDVNLVDGGDTEMEDKRDYRSMLVLRPMFFPPGMGFRYQRLLSDNLSVFGGGG